jgi:hypothetical protein
MVQAMTNCAVFDMKNPNAIALETLDNVLSGIQPYAILGQTCQDWLCEGKYIWKT